MQSDQTHPQPGPEGAPHPKKRRARTHPRGKPLHRLAAAFRTVRTVIRITQQIVRSVIRFVILIFRLVLIFLILAGLYIILIKPLRHAHSRPESHPPSRASGSRPAHAAKPTARPWMRAAGRDSAWFLHAPGKDTASPLSPLRHKPQNS